MKSEYIFNRGARTERIKPIEIKRGLTGITICGLLILALIFTSCSETENPSGEENSAEKKIVISYTINIPMEKVESLNPIISTSEDVFFMSKLLYRSLFQLGENLQAEADLVESFEYLSDGSLYLTIKDGVFWEDGTPLTENDVKFTIDAILALPQSSNSLYLDSSSAIRFCKIDGEGGVLIAFNSASSRGLENLLFPVMPSHKYTRVGDLLKDKKDFLPMGSGSYKIDEIAEGEYISLVGSSDYSGILPENNLVFTFLRNKEDAINLFDTEEVNLALLRQIDRGTLVAGEKTEVHSFVSNEVEVLIFNTEGEKLQDSGIRRAIASAIDRKTIIHNSYFQSGVVNDGLYFPAYLGVNFSGEKATEAVGKMNLTLIYNSQNNSRKIAGDLIKNDLEEIGIDLSVVGLAREEYQLALEKGDFDLCLGGYQLNRKYDLRPILQSGGKLNYASYSNESMDELLNKMQSGLDLGRKRNVYRQIQEIYAEDMPYLCLLYKSYGLAVTKGLAGDIEPTFDNIYKGIENWQINYEID